MFAWRFGEIPPAADLAVLRGIEGARIKESYRLLAHRHGVAWSGRRYERDDPVATDLPNQAIDHAASAVEGAAMIAVAATVPQLGFVHEDSAKALVLDIADLLRTTVTVPIAFAAARPAATTRPSTSTSSARCAGAPPRGSAPTSSSPA